MQVLFATYARLLNRLDTLTRLRGWRVLTRLEPAFVLISVVGLVIAMIALRLDLEALREERTTRAWQTVAAETRGNTGKREALQFLARNGHALSGIHVAPNSLRKDGDRLLLACGYRVYIPGLNLPNVNATGANLSCADLVDFDGNADAATFSDAVLDRASLVRAHAEHTDFSRATLTMADFRGAQLGGAKFVGATLTQARFEYSSLQSVAFDDAAVEGISIDHASLQGATGLDCDRLKTMQGWRTACRSPELRCCEPNIPEPNACGPDAIPPPPRFPQTAQTPSTSPSSSTATCANRTDLRREIEFRLDQVGRVVDPDPNATHANKEVSCDQAISMYVVAKLGGISQRPPPKEDETVWVSGSGYGYRHIPFKSGVRSDSFISYDLPQLGADYLNCVDTDNASKDLLRDEVKAAVDEFDAAIASGAGDETRICDDGWWRKALSAWGRVNESLRSVLAIDE